MVFEMFPKLQQSEHGFVRNFGDPEVRVRREGVRHQGLQKG